MDLFTAMSPTPSPSESGPSVDQPAPVTPESAEVSGPAENLANTDLSASAAPEAEHIGQTPDIPWDPGDVPAETPASGDAAEDESVGLPPRLAFPHDDDVSTAPPADSATAEERLLQTIRGPDEPETASSEPMLSDELKKVTDELNELREAGRIILADRDEALAEARRAREDAERHQARCNALQSDLDKARTALDTEHRRRTEESGRNAEAERALKQKLSDTLRLLDEVRETRDALTRRRFTPFSLAAAIVLAVAASGITLLCCRQAPTSETAAATPAAVSPRIAPPPAPPVLPAGTVPAPGKTPLPSPAPGKPAAVSGPAAARWPAIPVSRIKATPGTGGELLLVFTYGIFERGTNLSAQAKDDLHQLARVLQPLTDTARLTIEGYADTAPVTSKGGYKNNQELAMSRARIVRDLLTREASWPSTSAAVAAGKEETSPYPNTTEESRRKNRTVTIKLRRLQTPE